MTTIIAFRLKTTLLLPLLFAAALVATPSPAQDAPTKKGGKKKAPPRENAGMPIGENKATPISRIRVNKDFKVELVYSVPFAEQGSWVNLCVDDKGRIIASDQYGGLYRFPVPPPGKELDPGTIEKIPAEIRAANGLLWAFGALYVGVNDYENKIDSGLYRVYSSKGDDTLDKFELLRSMNARGDHGVHAVLPTPDGKALYLITGDGTKPVLDGTSRVPRVWGEDHLLPRMPDGRGFMRDVMAPGGIVYRVTPDGKNFEIYSSGYRNIFDAAINHEGELFTYDADMEYDFNTSWYRPTRVNHVVSGSEYGWRNGAGKWPPWYPDSLPATINVGPGSPTGMTFGYGAKFPAKYQEAMYGCDWSWGRLYAFHLKPDGSSYTATKEEFLNGAPLPLTDIIINPKDGAMYFTIGGRKVQSGLYRVTYTGAESTAPAKPSNDSTAQKARALRQKLEAYHGVKNPAAVKEAWQYLDHKDRFIRSAARVAIEWQPVDEWKEKALGEKNPARQLEALLALTRVTGIDRFHRKDMDPPVDLKMRARILAALIKFDWKKLSDDQRITLVRDYEITLNRFGKPDDSTVQSILTQLDPQFPTGRFDLNWMLCETLVFLQSPTIASKAIPMVLNAASQEEQIEYARSLRMLKAGWTPQLHTDYFEWFLKASNMRGGASFSKFIEFIRNDAVASLSETEKVALKDELDKKPVKMSPLEAYATVLAGRTKSQEWKLDDLAADAEKGMKNRNFDTGRKMFGATGCVLCHRFGNEGGMTAPDLTTAGARYSPKDLLDQIINPSKEINEQFVPMVITRNDGETVTGVIVNLQGDTVRVNTDPADPNQQVGVDRKDIKKMEPSKISPMPEGLLNILRKDEILDLVAYVLSGGNPKSKIFANR